MDDTILKYPYPIDNFRSLMDQFRINNQYRWLSSSNDTLWIVTDRMGDLRSINDKNDGWEVILLEPDNDGKLNAGNRRGVIQAFEIFPNETSINFHDGKTYHQALGFVEKEKIGQSFKELIYTITSMIEETDRDIVANSNAPKQIKKSVIPNWWPKQRAKKLRWKGMYKKIKPLLDDGLSFTEISERTGIRRQNIGHIIEWAESSPEAHDR